MPCRFTKDLKVSNNRIDSFLISTERFKIQPLNVLLYVLNRFEHVFYSELPIPRLHGWLP